MGAEAALAGVLLAAGAGVGAVSNVVQNQQKKKDADKAKSSAANAAAIQSKQVQQQAALERQKALRVSQITRARAVASAAESGFAVDSGDVDALLDSIASDAGINLGVIDQNRQNSLDLIESRRQAEFAQLDSTVENPFPYALIGGLGGVATGLSLVQASDAIGDAATADEALRAARGRAGNSVQ